MKKLKKHLEAKFKEYYEKDTWDCNTKVDQSSFDIGYFRAIEDILTYIELNNM